MFYGIPARCVGLALLSSMALCCALSFARSVSSSATTSANTSGTTGFVFDGNRMYAELAFVRPDGSIHKSLAFVDMGSPSVSLSAGLFKELGLDAKQALNIRIGKLAVSVPATQVSSEPGEGYLLGSDRKVEAELPAAVLEKYEVVIDYQARTITLAQPGTVKASGIAVPFRINKQTGLIAVEVRVEGKPYAITIDNGSAYTWVRQDAAREWLGAHPDWGRGVGAVGASNMMMSGDGAEATGLLLRIPEVVIGSLKLKEVGALGAGPGRGFESNMTLFDWYSTKNAVPVIGWIGGNVLKAFRIAIDYPNQTMYWERQSAPDRHDLDQVGLTLTALSGEYTVAAVATKNGRPTVEGVLPGDKLTRIGNLALGHATWGAIYAAMHGKPGDVRSLTLERAGKQIVVKAGVTAF